MIGTHNSFSYLAPKKWWQCILSPWTKCQSKTITEQYHAGARLFDIRIRFDKDYYVQVVHNKVVFQNHNIYNNLQFLHSTGTPIALRMILDIRQRPSDEDKQVEHFNRFCAYIRRKYTNLTIREQIIYWNWSDSVRDTKLHLSHRYSSVQKFPWNILPIKWFALLHNKKTLQQYNNDDPDNIALIDFI